MSKAGFTFWISYINLNFFFFKVAQFEMCMKCHRNVFEEGRAHQHTKGRSLGPKEERGCQDPERRETQRKQVGVWVGREGCRSRE